jgi:PAS domain S-box-containing protein
VTPFPAERYANVYGREITERKRVEAALRESENRYRSYIEMTEQLGWSTNADGEVAEDIPTWRKFTGQSEEEVKGWGWSKALHPDDLEHTALVWRNAVATRSNYEVEYRIRRYDGVYRHFLARGVPVFKDDGNILEWVGTCVDITERNLIEQALRDSEQRLNRSQEIAHLGSWELDLINNRLTWSDEVYRIFGLQPQEFGATYEAFLEHVHPDDRAAVDASYSGSVREGRDTYEIEHRVVRKSTGETRIVHERCGHIRDTSGRIIRSIGMVHDITERKRAGDALQQRTIELQQLTETLEQRVQGRTKEVEAANEALKAEIDECARIEIELKKSESDLRQLSAALLSAQERERKLIAQEIHDSMGASLAATKFKVETALEEMGDDNPQTRAALGGVIPIIQGTIEEARRIQMSLRPSVLDDLGILATINWFCRQFETTYSNIRIKKEIEIEENEVPDSLKIVIYRVLQEALNNIAKHSKAAVVLLFLQKTDQTVQLVIRDSGQGFDLEETYSRKGTARGLGLDSMRERTELSGGSFSIESNKGKGTTIRASWRV